MERTTFLTRRRNVVLLAILCCMLWGSATPFIKMGYRLLAISGGDTASLILFAGVRFTLSGVLVVAMGSIPQHHLLTPKSSSWGMILRLCLFQTVMQYVCYYVGLAHSTAVKASIVNSTGTFLCILVASLIFHQEPLRPRKVVGCAIGFAGVILVNLTPRGFGGGLNFLGEGFLLLAALAYAISSTLLKNYSAAESPVALSGYQFLLGGMIMIVAGLLTGGQLHPQSWTAFPVLGYLAFLSAAAYSIWGLLLQHNPVSRVAIFGFLNPICGVVLSAVLLRESQHISSLQCIAALALVSGGIYIINRPEREEAA
ncbi:MAG: DMT family transporter [Oscillospiraceae bacterium]|nr:DMT family transporter [Oscillospiraceae bacterium]